MLLVFECPPGEHGEVEFEKVLMIKTI